MTWTEVLSRELRENAKRSYELAVAITGALEIVMAVMAVIAYGHGIFTAYSYPGDPVDTLVTLVKACQSFRKNQQPVWQTVSRLCI